MEKIKDKCFAGNCIHVTHSLCNGCMVCNSRKHHTDGRDKYIYPVVYEDCDCGDYQDGTNMNPPLSKDELFVRWLLIIAIILILLIQYS